MGNDFIEEIYKVFDEYVDISKQLINEKTDPDENSQAKKDLNNQVFRSHTASVLSLGVTLREIAADNLMGIQRLLRNPIMTFAPFVLFRGLVEVSALSIWLTSKNIEVKERIERYFTYRNYSLHEEIKYLKASRANEKIPQIVKKIDELKSNAQNLDIKINTMPTKTQMIIDMLDAESTYRLFSAIAHGQHWAYLKSSFKVGKEEIEIFEGVKGGYLEKSIDPISIVYLCLFSIRYLTKAEIEQFLYYGWDEKPLSQLVDSTTEKLMKITKEFGI